MRLLKASNVNPSLVEAMLVGCMVPSRVPREKVVGFRIVCAPADGDVYGGIANKRACLEVQR